MVAGEAWVVALVEPAADRLRFTVLGAVRAWRDGAELDLGTPKQRVMMASLLVRAGHPVSLGEIVDVLWGHDPPASAVNVVHRHVGILRRVLEPALPSRAEGRWLRRCAGGYRLDADDVDLLRFRALRAQAAEVTAAGQLDQAARLYLAALDLWRGPCADGIDPEARTNPVFTAVDQEQLAAIGEATDLVLRAGLSERLLPAVRRAAAAMPLDEPLQARLMLLLGASGHQAEALAVFDGVRTALANELGIDPGPELCTAQERVLNQQTATPPPEPRPEPPRPAQLPADLSTFTGRAAALAFLADKAEAPATVVISAIGGTAGIGKTTLAVHWSHRVADRFPDGQLYVNLRGFDATRSAMAAEEALRGFLEALGVPEGRIPAQVDAQAAQYRSLLAGRRVLVLLDNARDVEQVRPLLPGSVGCSAIVTSRTDLSGLVATDGADPLTLDLLTVGEAQDFLARRLGASRVTAEPDAVEEIIARCSRLPLALAVVAARAASRPDFPLAALAAELREQADNLDAFAGGDAGTDLRAVLSWSYRTLDVAAARLLRLLSAHPGPDVDAPAAASLCGLPVRQIRSLLGTLANAHLISEHVPGRYRFHDLLRAYAAELADTDDSADDLRAARHRVLDHYLHTANPANHLLSPNQDRTTLAAPLAGVVPEKLPDQQRALTWFSTERQVLLAAIDQAARHGFDAHAYGLSMALDVYCYRQGHWHDWVSIRRTALSAAQRLAEPDTLTQAHLLLGHALRQTDQLDQARQQFHQALRLATEASNANLQAHTHRGLGYADLRQARYASGLSHCQRAGDLYRVAGNRAGEAKSLNESGMALVFLGEYRRAVASCEAALALFQELGDVPGETATLDSLGLAHHHLGNLQQAIGYYERCLGLSRELGDRNIEAEALTHIADSYHELDQRDLARQTWEKALPILVEIGHSDVDRVRRQLDAVSPAIPGRGPDR